MKHVLNFKWRWLAFSVFILTAVGFASLSFTSAFARARRVSAIESTDGARRGAIYSPDIAGFSFSTPQALLRPALSGVSVLKDQDIEPEIKVDIFGNIYATAIHGVPGGVDLWKSTDQGTNFIYLGEPDGAQDRCNVAGTAPCTAGAGGGDDSLDVSSGGYVYLASLYLGGTTLSASYDGATGGVVPGQAWAVNPAAGGVPVNDRQWIAAYGPQTVYMTFDQAPAPGPLWFTKSTDAGKTWSAPSMIAGAGTFTRENNLAVDQYNGNIYTTYFPSPDQLILLKSTNGGTTWTTSTAYTGPAGSCLENAFPIIAVDRGGNVHIAFTQSSNGCGPVPARTNAHVFLISSADAGANWTPPVQIDNGPGNNSTVMPWIVAGSPGVVDVTWYGSTMSSPDSTPANVSQRWNVFFAQVTNALSPTPTIAQTIVAGAVHHLPICSQGSACPGNTRDLGEYYAMTLDPDGNAHITYVDEINYCAAHPATNCLAHTFYTRQTGGPSAYAPPAPPAPATFAANLTMPGSAKDAEPNMRADSHNCLYSAAPGAPDAWKSTNAGVSFFKLPNAVVSAGGVAGGGDSEIVTFPQPSGARPDQIYYADLAVASVNISKSIDGGASWFPPGTNGAAGEVSVSTDRQWMSADRSGANQTIYLWEHEFVTQILRMNALTNDTAWSPFASGMTDPELIAPPGSTIQNTVPGPTFVDPATHQVYGFLSASTVATNAIGAPTGKLPNVWEADGPGTFTSPIPPGPFVNHPVFKGVLDSPANPAPPAGTKTFGSNTANLFNGATIDAAGNIYAAWATPNARTGLYDVWFASSHNHGQTFYGPFRINQSATQGNMPWIAAGDDGRVDIVFYGTPGTQDPTTSTTDAWNVMFAQSLNANSREPVFTVSQASDHVMHVGPICNVGILCGAGTRQLLDFFQVAIGPDGLANIAYADTGAGNGDSHISYARQNSGPLAVANPNPVTCLPGPPVPLAIVSRKVHGTAGTFDVDLKLPAPGIECRTGGANGDFQMVITFPLPITITGATVTAGTGSVVNATASGNVVTVNLTGVTNAQRLTVRLNTVTDANGSGNVPINMAVLLGDTTADTFVNSGDIAQTKSQSGTVVTTSNFREDVTVDGNLNSGDIALVKSKSGTALP